MAFCFAIHANDEIMVNKSKKDQTKKKSAEEETEKQIQKSKAKHQKT